MLNPNERLAVEAVRNAEELVVEVIDKKGETVRIRLRDHRFAHDVALALQDYLGDRRRILKKS